MAPDPAAGLARRRRGCRRCGLRAARAGRCGREILAVDGRALLRRPRAGLRPGHRSTAAADLAAAGRMRAIFSYLAADGDLGLPVGTGTRTRCWSTSLPAGSAATSRTLWSIVASHGTMVSSVRAL